MIWKRSCMFKYTSMTCRFEYTKSVFGLGQEFCAKPAKVQNQVRNYDVTIRLTNLGNLFIFPCN